MSLDDAVNRARWQAEMYDDQQRREQERQRQEREAVVALGIEAAQRLAGWGNERYVLVQVARWYQFAEYRDANQRRYKVIASQPCWKVTEMSGVRDPDGEGPFRHSPVLLLADGRIGRFWPEPERLHQMSMVTDGVAYVSTCDLDPVEQGTFLFHYGRGIVDELRDRLGAMIVDYEREGIRRPAD